jgi:hypothetical protein
MRASISASRRSRSAAESAPSCRTALRASAAEIAASSSAKNARMTAGVNICARRSCTWSSPAAGSAGGTSARAASRYAR